MAVVRQVLGGDVEDLAAPAEALRQPVAPVRPPAERGYWRGAVDAVVHDPNGIVGLVLVGIVLVATLLAPLIAPHPAELQLADGLTGDGQPIAPGNGFLFGTDALGRDELSRLLYGARVSLAVGLGAGLLAGVLGTAIGGVAGLAGRMVQTILMRSVDVLLSFPVLLLAITVLAVAEPGVLTITVIVGISFAGYLSRIVFAQTVTLREREFVVAARASGVRTGRVLTRHIVPHVLPSVIVFCTLGTATAIQLEAALSYVGIGIRPPSPSWGNMISEGQDYLTTAPWLVIAPGCAIVLTMLGFSLLGDAMRDALDPTLERRARFPLGGLR